MWLYNDFNRIHNRNDSSLSIVYKNDKDAILDLCLRNAIKYARGEITYTLALNDQMKFAYENCNHNTREIFKVIFDLVRFDV